MKTVGQRADGTLDPLNFDETEHLTRYPGVPDEIDFYATIEEWRAAEDQRLAAGTDREDSFPDAG